MKKTLLTLGILTFAFFSVFAQTKTTTAKTPVSPVAVNPVQNNNPNAPEMTFEKTVYDYGTIANGADPNYQFKFKNTGKEPLIIIHCQGTWGCTVSVCPTEPILPGRTGIIKGTYATTRTGKFTKTINITTNAKTPAAQITITGEVLAPVTNTGTPEKPVNNGSTPVNNSGH